MKSFHVLLLSFFFLLLVQTGFAVEKSDEKEAARKEVEDRTRAHVMNYFLGNPMDSSGVQGPAAIELYNDAVEFYQKKEFELAKLALHDSLGYDKSNPFAFELLGDIHYFEQNLPEAQKNYESAYKLNPRKDLKEKLEKLQRERPVEAGLVTYQEEHFIIKYAGEDKGMEGFELRELLRNNYREVGQDLGYFFKHKVVVLLYDEKKFRELSGAPHWSSGLYDGKIRLPAYRAGFSETEIKKVMRHELTHAFVGEISRGFCPIWLNEGLAEWEEAKVGPPDLKVFRAAVKINGLFPLSTLFSKTKLAETKDPLEVQLFYEQSYQLVRYLIDRYGMFYIKRMLELYAHGKDNLEVIETVFKVSPLELEKQWKQNLPR